MNLSVSTLYLYSSSYNMTESSLHDYSKTATLMLCSAPYMVLLFAYSHYPHKQAYKDSIGMTYIVFYYVHCQLH